MGPSPAKWIQLRRGCAPLDAAATIADGTALRFDPLPVDTQGRPHCIRPTLGWRMEARWDRNHAILVFHLSSFLRQRRFVLEPRVAVGRPLPWVYVPTIRFNRNAVARCAMFAAPNRAEPRCGSILCPLIPKVGLIVFGQPWAGGRKPVGLSLTAFGQPWAGGWKPVGIRIMPFWLFIFHLSCANGVSSLSPGLRSAGRYPGFTFPPHDSTATRLRAVRCSPHPTGRNRVAVRSFAR